MTQIRVKCGANVYGWASRGGEISNIVTAYIKKMAAIKVKNGAKEKIIAMKEAELKERILRAMEDYPQLYKYFV